MEATASEVPHSASCMRQTVRQAHVPSCSACSDSSNVSSWMFQLVILDVGQGADWHPWPPLHCGIFCCGHLGQCHASSARCSFSTFSTSSHPSTACLMSMSPPDQLGFE